MSLPVAAAIVNHGTPDLTRMAVWSLRSLYASLHILVVESGSPDDSADRLATLAGQVQPFTLIACSENVHHGPGLDLALRQLDTPWVLVFDSDCIAYRAGFLEGMLAAAGEDGAYMVGDLLHVDDSGFASAGGHPYVHPRCALVRREVYATLPPFERHGAPCLANAKAAAAQGLVLQPFPVDDYVYHLGRGTVERYGYALGAGSRWAEVRRRVRRMLG